jgi:carboxylesterase type B
MAQYAIHNTSFGQYRALVRDGQPLQFLGIPYASARRWEYPMERMEPFTDATTKGPSCPQICRNVAAFCPEIISEDCLTLNIWTPLSDVIQLTRTQLPVLVFIHGGSFEHGSGSLLAFNGTYLATRLQAVIVTFNYRVSLLGFPGFSMDSRLPINPGIADQKLALSWVHQRISQFGGNPQQMTLMGQSAGASAAIVHLSQEPTTKWFQRGILFSVPAVPFQSSSQGRKSFQDFAHFLQCLSTDRMEQRACLDRFSMRDLLDSYERFVQVANRGQTNYDPWLKPVVDGFEIESYPLDALERLKGKEIIVGTTADEMSRIVDNLVPPKAPESATVLFSNALFGNALRPTLEVQYHWRSNTSREVLTTMLSDSLFICPVHRSSILAAQHNFIYEYFWEMPWVGGRTDVLGRICGQKACHTTDLVYFFNQAASFEQESVADGFRMRLKSFIEGNGPHSLGGQAWRPITTVQSTLVVGQTTRLISHPRSDHCELWNQKGYLYQPTYHVPPSPTFDGIDSKWILSVLVVFLSVLGIQLLLLIRTRFARQVLFVSIRNIQEKRSNEMFSEKSDDYIRLMAQILDIRPTPVQVTVNGLDYFANSNQKHILKDIHAMFAPKTMTAILGPSGSGKTTLLSLVLVD